MNIANDFAVVTGQNKPGRIEVGLGKDQFVKLVAPQTKRGASAKLTFLPQPKNVRRILVSELSVFDHSECLNDRRNTMKSGIPSLPVFQSILCGPLVLIAHPWPLRNTSERGMLPLVPETGKETSANLNIQSTQQLRGNGSRVILRRWGTFGEARNSERRVRSKNAKNIPAKRKFPCR